ncbi:Interferon-induced GTP-binding protein Mx1 [Lachnellula suecica]|uniref:Interferon-induced GTP-binding protein Mx1 n=1 Tax=Lachnellula suecica TaxID=602035 RepID=A0A8T9CJU3_9HELO|nr:Interferon-induced GTP-binding protein Mx1 [Lachnellula suecica]
MVPRGSNAGLKRESTVSHGLITPDESMTSIGTIHPKEEELDSVSLSDRLQDHQVQGNSIRSHHGLRSFEGENPGSESTDRYRRSASVSVRSSFPPPPPPPLLQPRIHNYSPPASPSTMSPADVERNPGLAIVGRDSKILVDALEKMRRIGLQSVVDQLPELLLVGDQSAGKSSLLAAIAGISLPRGQSMCTKCPTNIKTQHDATKWTCKVSLEIKYTWTDKMDHNMPFPNWEPRKEGPNNQEFTSIDDEKELEYVLKWAQIALLNPSRDPTSFVPGTTSQAREALQRPNDPVAGEEPRDQARFSPNVIAIEISGPGLPALSFYDLPGLFNSPDHKDQKYLVKVFNNLTQKYIKHENALIICAISMANDPSNSKAVGVIQDNQAEDRCIGVLTMPDRLQGEDIHSDYNNILHQKTFILPHGYFVTKQPGPASKHLAGRPDYYDLARKEEDEFFRTAKFWKDGDEWAIFKSRCGTRTIQRYLSDQFAKLILSSIPDLEQKIFDETKDVDSQLAQIPEISQNQGQNIVRQRLIQFSAKARELFDSTTTFRIEWKHLCYQFQRSLEAMRPGCYCGHPSDKEPIVIDLLDDDDDDSPPPPRQPRTPQNKGKHKADGFETPDPKRHQPAKLSTPIKFEASPKPSLNAKDAKVMQRRFERMKDDGYGPFYQKFLITGFRVLSLQDLEYEIQAQSVIGFPENIPPKVREDPAIVSIAPWEHPLKIFLHHTFDMLRNKLLSILAVVLVNHRDTELYKQSVGIIEKYLSHHEMILREQSGHMYEVEKSGLFTINHNDFDRNKAEALEGLRSARRRLRATTYVNNQPRKNDNKSTEELISKVTDQQLGPDKYERELEVAAFARGYYTTARVRFVDSICANLNMALFQVIKTGFERLLETELGTDSANCEATCQELLSGNLLLVQRRNELRRRKAQLAEFTEVLDRLRNPQAYDENRDLNLESDNELPDPPRSGSSMSIQQGMEAQYPNPIEENLTGHI